MSLEIAPTVKSRQRTGYNTGSRSRRSLDALLSSHHDNNLKSAIMDTTAVQVGRIGTSPALQAPGLLGDGRASHRGNACLINQRFGNSRYTTCRTTACPTSKSRYSMNRTTRFAFSRVKHWMQLSTKQLIMYTTAALAASRSSKLAYHPAAIQHTSIKPSVSVQIPDNDFVFATHCGLAGQQVCLHHVLEPDSVHDQPHWRQFPATLRRPAHIVDGEARLVAIILDCTALMRCVSL